MKKVLFSILCMLTFLGAWSQSSEPWFYDGKQWARLAICECPESEMTITSVIQGSVEIEGMTYWKVYESRKEDLSELESSHYYLREDGGRIYRYYPETKEEMLFLDFNLKEGDDFMSEYEPIKILAVTDTILPGGDGISRKCIKTGFLSDGPVMEEWVEGIGSLNTGIEWLNIGTTGGGSDLLCCHDGNKSLYQNEEYGTCFRESVSIHELPEEAGIEARCIAKGTVCFKWDEPSDFCSLSIYTEDGNLYQRKTIVTGHNQATFNGIPAGIYFYVLNSSKKESVKGRVYVK